MSRRMNWDKRRAVHTPWYARLDRDPFGREAVRYRVRPSVKPKPTKPKQAPVTVPLERPTAPAGALAPKYVLRTCDIDKARAALSGASEAVAWSDGSCAPTNPGPIGCGVVIVAGNIRVEIFGGAGKHGTNNAAELEAAVLALTVLPAGCRTTMNADSTYLVNGMQKWRHNWRTRDFKKNGLDIPNAALWRKLDALVAGRLITWQWVRGHSGNQMNGLADRLAMFGRRGA